MCTVLELSECEFEELLKNIKSNLEDSEISDLEDWQEVTEPLGALEEVECNEEEGNETDIP